MKFGDKLIQLRKKSGLSQEELAAKLNVSRQSVSKWESNNTYPETDKIIQICNIFDCTMDDLINENIKDITTIERKNKKELNINIDSLLEFVTKTVNLFYNMKFLSGLKCLIELGLVVGILVIIGVLASEIITAAIVNIFSFLPWKVLGIIDQVVGGIINLAWIVITIIVVVHVFKIRYLDYYEQVINEDKSKEEIKEKTEESRENISIERKKFTLKNKGPHIIIRDKEPFAFLNIFAKMALWFIKSIAIIIGLFLAFILLLGIIGLVISISLSAYSQIFIGFDIGIVGALIAVVLTLGIIIRFVLGTKFNVKLFITLFFVSIVITGVGIGVGITALKDITIAEDLTDILEITTHETKIEYKNNLVIVDEFPRTYEYIIDDSIYTNEIIVQNDYDSRFNRLHYYETIMHGMPVYNFWLSGKANIKDMYNIIISDLKNNTFRDYNTYLYRDDIKIIASKPTIDKLINNFSKIYIYDQETTPTGYKITNISDRIINTYSECSSEYNALTGEITASDYCKCLKEENKATGIIEYTCHYIDDNNEE